MISIDRLEEMTIEELQTKLKNFEEQIKLQNNFIDSLFKATNNSEWLDKSMLDDEVSEVIEKIELDYEQLDQLKAENEELKKTVDDLLHKPEIKDKILWKIDNEALLGSKDTYIYKLKQTLTEIKALAIVLKNICPEFIKDGNDSMKAINEILQKISEVE